MKIGVAGLRWNADFIIDAIEGDGLNLRWNG
jgi:hypothetical protein